MDIRRAKFLLPRRKTALVRRPHLIQRLNASLELPLTMVIGPAGFGKTTLLSEWSEAVELDVAWLTLDAADSDLRRFVANVVHAIQTIHPDWGASTLGALKRAHHGPQSLGAMVGDELLDLPADVVLILDDYNEIVDSRVHDFLDEVLHYPSPCLHLVISSRNDPPIALARLRGRGWVDEVRAANLRFTTDETRSLLQLVSSHHVDERVVNLFQERTEGWVAGLRLASLALDGASDQASLAEAMVTVEDRHIMDFLVEEVLARQPSIVQDFLLRTSIVDRVCGDLGDALLDDAPSGAAREALDWLARGDLYMEQQADDPAWHVFHPLFREFLRHRLALVLDAERIADLHRRASAWFVAHGQIDDAISHSVEGHDESTAADLVEHHIDEARLAEDWPRLEAWLDQVPGRMIETRPALLLARSWIGQIRFGAVDGTSELLRGIDVLLDEDASPEADASRTEARLISLESEPFDTNLERFLVTAEDVLPRLRPDQRFAQGRARYWLVRALQASGRTDEAGARLDVQLRGAGTQAGYATLFPLYGLAIAHLADGDLYDAELTARYLYSLANQHDSESGRHRALFVLGCIAYERNELESAIEHFSAATLGMHEFIDVSTIESLMGLTLALQADGRQEDADTTLQRLVTFVLEMGRLGDLNALHAFEARLALARGDQLQAYQWLDAPGVTVDSSEVGSFDVALITRARILLAEGSPENVEAALRHIDQLSVRAATVHHRQREISCLVLRSVALAAQGLDDQARSTLESALTAAEPKGMVRTIIDQGPQVVPLLRDIARDTGSTYASQLLSSFGASASTPSRFKVYTLLTEREAQVLSGLSKRLSNQEIADELYISPLTVKRHAGNIYNKLGVSNRRQALLRADELGILPPST